MSSSPAAGPPSIAKPLYACCTFGDLLGCLARLRFTVEPLPGMEYLGGRPVVTDGISAQDAARLSGPADYEFPVLVEIPAATRCERGWLAQSVPVAQAGAVVFRSDAERERIVNTMLDDVPVEGLATRVEPGLFERAEAAIPAEEPRSGQPSRVPIADAAGGALCGLLLAVARRRECAQLLLDGFPGPWRHWPGAVEILSVVAQETPPGHGNQSLALAAFTAARGLSGKPGLDADGILDQFLGVLDGWLLKDEAKTVEAWNRFAREITSWQRALSAAEVRDPIDDKGNVVLRALLLSLFRERVDHVLEDPVESELPGPRVALIAAMLVGMRTGLQRCSRDLKQPFAATLGELAASVESPEDASSVLKSCLPTARYLGRGRSRTLHVVDHARRTIAEHPAPEETLLERIVTVLSAGGITVTTVEGQSSVTADGETVYLANVPTVPAAPVKAPRKRRTKTVEAADATEAATTPVTTSVTESADAGREKDETAVSSTARKSRGRRKKAAVAVDTDSDPARAAVASPEPYEPTKTSDMFDQQKPAKE
jgi:hypothetical protein